MNNVVALSDPAPRCGECRHAQNCPCAPDTAENSACMPARRVRVAHQGDRIFGAGDPADALYMIRVGSVKTIVMDRNGEEQVTGFHGPGEWLGLDATHGGEHRTDAVALDTVAVCVVPHSLLRERLRGSPLAGQRIMRIFSDRLEGKDRMHASLAQDGAERRLAAFLCDLSARSEAAGLNSDHLVLSMSRGEMASYLALAVETVSRLLTRMQRCGILKVQRQQLDILDRAALRDLAGLDPEPSASPRRAQQH